MDKDWMVLLKGQNQLSNVIKTNETTEQFGLSLTEEDAKLILAERKNALAEQKELSLVKELRQKSFMNFAILSTFIKAIMWKQLFDCRKYFIYIKMKCMMKLQMMNFSI